MKKALIAVCLLSLCLGFSACGKAGTTDNVSIKYGASQRFNEDEIAAAGNTVIGAFKSYKDCDLLTLTYDEEYDDNMVDGYMGAGNGAVNGVERENVIALYSDFTVGASGADSGLNPNSTCTGWVWILIRDSETGDWVLDDWGY